MVSTQEVSDEINAMLDYEIRQIMQRKAMRKAMRGPGTHLSFQDNRRLEKLKELKRSFNDGWWIPKQNNETG